MKKKMYNSLYALAILSGFSACFYSCVPQEAQEEPKVATVEIQQIKYDNNIYHQEYIGVVESENSVDVSALVSGTIEQLYVHEGQRVSKGKLIGRLNASSYKNAHEMTLSKLRQAEDAFKRISAMYENNSVPEIQFIEIKTQLDQARASEAIARKSLEDCNIYAPQSGVIGKRYLEPGANVMPTTPIVNMMNISQVKVKVAIPESEISSVRLGEICNVKISALNNETFKGQIVEKGISANPVSHTYNIKVKVNNSDSQIMPGMVCKVYMNNAGSSTGSIIVPIKSVQVDYSGKRFVWLKDKQNKAVYKAVTLGKLSENGVHITDGLQEGDELIIAGYQNLSEGTAVSVK